MSSQPPTHSRSWHAIALLSLLLCACASRAPLPDAEAAPDESPTVEVEAEASAETEKPEEPAEEDGPEAPPTPRQRACALERTSDVIIVDDTQALLTETGCRAALWLDGLFGETDDFEAAQRTNGYLETSVSHSEFEGTDFRTRLRVRFELPNIKERLSAFVGRDDEEDFVRDRSEGFALRSQFPRVDDQDEWLAGLGYSLPSSERFRSGVKVGAAGLTRPRVFVQGRLHYNAYADQDDVFYVRLTPFWNSRIGVGVTTALDYSHVLTPSLLARWSNVGTVSEKTEGMNWLSAVILYQNLREQRAIAYEGFVRGETEAPEPLYEYGARVIYRHPLVLDRLYGEFIVGYSFPRTDPTLPRDGSYEVGFGLHLPFGRPEEP
jgi:hypothetical protein